MRVFDSGGYVPTTISAFVLNVLHGLGRLAFAGTLEHTLQVFELLRQSLDRHRYLVMECQNVEALCVSSCMNFRHER